MDNIKFVELKFYLMYKKIRLGKFKEIKQKIEILIKLFGMLVSSDRDIHDVHFFKINLVIIH